MGDTVANRGYYLQDSFVGRRVYRVRNGRLATAADPRASAVWDATHALAGGGGFRSEDLYRFNPSLLSAPGLYRRVCRPPQTIGNLSGCEWPLRAEPSGEGGTHASLC